MANTNQQEPGWGELSWFFSRWLVGFALEIALLAAAISMAGFGFFFGKSINSLFAAIFLGLGFGAAGLSGRTWARTMYLIHCLPEVIEEMENE